MSVVAAEPFSSGHGAWSVGSDWPRPSRRANVMSDLLSLPPHLLDKIQALLIVDISLPDDLRERFERGIRRSSQQEASQADSPEDEDHPVKVGQTGDNGEPVITYAGNTPDRRPVIEVETLEHLARWATTPTGRRNMEREHLDPDDYGLISLLAGTQLYLPPNQERLLASSANPDRPNPYLPSYLSPSPASFGQEYRAVTRQLATVINILFSIFGSAGAVYVASTTGAGYSREIAIILAILAGCIVGIADAGLVWIVSVKSERERKESKRMAMEMSKGSGAIIDGEEGEKDGDGYGDDMGPAVTLQQGQAGPLAVGSADSSAVQVAERPEKTAIRLRRRDLPVR